MGSLVLLLLILRCVLDVCSVNISGAPEAGEMAAGKWDNLIQVLTSLVYLHVVAALYVV